MDTIRPAVSLFVRYPINVPADEVFLLSRPSYELFTALQLPRFVGGAYLVVKILQRLPKTSLYMHHIVRTNNALTPLDGAIAPVRVGYITSFRIALKSVGSTILRNCIHNVVCGFFSSSLDYSRQLPSVMGTLSSSSTASSSSQLLSSSLSSLLSLVPSIPAILLRESHRFGLALWFKDPSAVMAHVVATAKAAELGSGGATNIAIPRAIMCDRLFSTMISQLGGILISPFGQGTWWRLTDTSGGSSGGKAAFSSSSLSPSSSPSSPSASSSSSTRFLTSATCERFGLTAHDAVCARLACAVSDTIDALLCYKVYPMVKEWLGARKRRAERRRNKEAQNHQYPFEDEEVEEVPLPTHMLTFSPLLWFSRLFISLSSTLFVFGPLTMKLFGPTRTSIDAGGYAALPTVMLSTVIIAFGDSVAQAYGLQVVMWAYDAYKKRTDIKACEALLYGGAEEKKQKSSKRNSSATSSPSITGNVRTVGEFWMVTSKIEADAVENLLDMDAPAPPNGGAVPVLHTFLMKCRRQRYRDTATDLKKSPSSMRSSSSFPRYYATAPILQQEDFLAMCKEYDRVGRELFGDRSVDNNSSTEEEEDGGEGDTKKKREDGDGGAPTLAATAAAADASSASHHHVDMNQPLTPTLLRDLLYTVSRLQLFSLLSGLNYNSLDSHQVSNTADFLVTVYNNAVPSATSSVLLVFDLLLLYFQLCALDPNRHARQVYLMEQMLALGNATRVNIENDDHNDSSSAKDEENSKPRLHPFVVERGIAYAAIRPVIAAEEEEGEGDARDKNESGIHDTTTTTNNTANPTNIDINGVDVPGTRCGEEDDDEPRGHRGAAATIKAIAEIRRKEAEAAAKKKAEEAKAKDGDDECIVCLQPIRPYSKGDDTVRTCCKHAFHTACLMATVSQAGSCCPMCKTCLAPVASVLLSGMPIWTPHAADWHAMNGGRRNTLTSTVSNYLVVGRDYQIGGLPHRAAGDGADADEPPVAADDGGDVDVDGDGEDGGEEAVAMRRRGARGTDFVCPAAICNATGQPYGHLLIQGAFHFNHNANVLLSLMTSHSNYFRRYYQFDRSNAAFHRSFRWRVGAREYDPDHNTDPNQAIARFAGAEPKKEKEEKIDYDDRVAGDFYLATVAIQSLAFSHCGYPYRFPNPNDEGMTPLQNLNTLYENQQSVYSKAFSADISAWWIVRFWVRKVAGYSQKCNYFSFEK